MIHYFGEVKIEEFSTSIVMLRPPSVFSILRTPISYYEIMNTSRIKISFSKFHALIIGVDSDCLWFISLLYHGLAKAIAVTIIEIVRRTSGI